jgi:hypothetical protein
LLLGVCCFWVRFGCSTATPTYKFMYNIRRFSLLFNVPSYFTPLAPALDARTLLNSTHNDDRFGLRPVRPEVHSMLHYVPLKMDID